MGILVSSVSRAVEVGRGRQCFHHDSTGRASVTTIGGRIQRKIVSAAADEFSG